MTAVVQPLPQPTVDAILAWLQALDGRDIYNAFLGAATIGLVGFFLVIGVMALRRIV